MADPVPAANELARWRRRVEREKTARLEAEAIAERITREYYEVSHRLAEAQRVARLGSWDWDMLADRLTWSEELRRIFQVAPDQPIDFEAYLGRVHPEDRPRVADGISKARVDHESFEMQHRIQRPDGSTRVLHSRGAVRRDASGHAVGMSGTAHDITEEREAEEARAAAAERAQEVERLKELNGFKNTFINTAAHELFTPLTPLRLAVEVLRPRLDESKDKLALRQVDLMRRSVDRLHRLATNLLEVSRLETGELNMKMAPCFVEGIVDRAMAPFSKAAEAAGLRLEVTVEPGLSVQADAERLSGAVAQLLANAIKFTRRGGLVTVEVRRLSEQVVLSVTDDGIGIEPGRIDALFVPFSHAHAPTDQTNAGAGLGLYICRGVVELHDGTLRVHSAGTGQGTQVEIRLPLL